MSMRGLFSRREIAGEIISLRNSLSNHLGGAAIGLRDALDRFDKLSNGIGFESGCRPPDSLKPDLEFGGFKLRDLSGVLPQWVPVDPRDHRRLARTLEGVLLRSSITSEDFPLRPWHTFYDWNFFVEVDPQYRYLVSPEARRHNSETLLAKSGKDARDLIECEWDTAFLPLWAIPQEGRRLWLTGRWIFDCGHLGRPFGHRTEIHPPKAIVSFRSEAAEFEGNAGPTQANLAVIYIGRRGGYIDQAINDQNYGFDLYLPPRPHPAAEPKFAITRMTRPLPADPQVSFFPESNPRLARVVVPLAGVTTLEEYGAIVSTGWSDVDGTEQGKVKHFRVRFDRLDARGAPEPPSDDTWVFFFGVNGRWNKVNLTSDESPLNAAIELALHEGDALHVTACGFARRKIFDFMGEPSDVAPRFVSERSTTEEAADALGKLLQAFAIAVAKHGVPKSLGNTPLFRFSKIHRPIRPGAFGERAHNNPGLSKQETNRFDYRLAYTIELL